jgi:adenylate cyclase
MVGQLVHNSGGRIRHLADDALIFIVASTLRLDFVLPAFTGVVAAAGYLWGSHLGPLFSRNSHQPEPCHQGRAHGGRRRGSRAGRAPGWRAKFRRAVEEAVSRERVTNLFGQHLSPAVVDRLLDNPSEFTGDIREICVMFLNEPRSTPGSYGVRPQGPCRRQLPAPRRHDSSPEQRGFEPSVPRNHAPAPP